MVEVFYIEGTFKEDACREANVVNRKIQIFADRLACRGKACVSLFAGVERSSHLHFHGIICVEAHQAERFKHRLDDREIRSLWVRCSGGLAPTVEYFETGRSVSYILKKHEPRFYASCSRTRECRTGCKHPRNESPHFGWFESTSR